MFKWNRILVALIGVPLLIFVYTDKIFYGIPLLIFTNLVVGIGTYEFYKMMKSMNKLVYDKFGIFISILIPNIIYFSYLQEAHSLNIPEIKISYILILATIFMLVYRVFKNQVQGTVEIISLTLTGIIYISLLFSTILDIYFIDFYRHTWFLLFIQILVWVSDTFAGIVGMAIGRKFFKNGFTEISPKKSVEGALASLFFTGLAAMIGGYFLKGDLIWFFLMGILISFIAQIGDLVESLFKRESGVKDSGTILMGHGGILDRFDSMILVLPVVYLFIFKLLIL